MSNGIYGKPEIDPATVSTAVAQVFTVVKSDGSTVNYDLVAFADIVVRCELECSKLSSTVQDLASAVGRLTDRIEHLESRNRKLHDALADFGPTDRYEDPDI
jgi:hypothetical protein